MFSMEEVVCELSVEYINHEQGGLPPGFRFHPTDEELITFYLASKVFNGSFCGVEIAEVDLNRCEPWELPDVAKMGEREWYFYSVRDRKYPTGLRTNRATGAGYWKATGKDREVYSTASSGALLGMKKTLVFYKGRAPRGEKTKWVMHEYRLDGDFSYRHACKEEWVICRITHKLVEKKNPNFQGQSYLFEASSSSPTTTSLPTLLESQISNNSLVMQALQNPFLNHHHESDLKYSIPINPVVSQPNLIPINNGSGILQTTFSPTLTSHDHNNTITTTNKKDTDPNNNPSPSSGSSTTLFKSLLSHQDFTWKKQTTSTSTTSTSTNTTTTIPKQSMTEANFSHFQLSDTNLSWVDKIHQNPLFFGMDCSVMGFSSSADAVHEMSTSIAFNRAGFHMMVDPPSMRVTGESWPLGF